MLLDYNYSILYTSCTKIKEENKNITYITQAHITRYLNTYFFFLVVVFNFYYIFMFFKKTFMRIDHNDEERIFAADTQT